MSTPAPPAALQWPLEFDYHLRPQVWGGEQLGTVCHKPLPSHHQPTGHTPIGEAWDLSTHHRHQSRVSTGPLRGQSLSDLWSTWHPLWTGQELPASPPFPWLLKWLDCTGQLSVQVHPSDELARLAYGEATGKSEVWVVVAAQPGGWVVTGVKAGLGQSDIVQALAGQTLLEHIQFHPAQVGDCYVLPAGTLHCAGDGVLLAEVQQPSDLTLRLYDWDRPAFAAASRPLQTAQALEAIHWERTAQAPIQPFGKPIQQGKADPHAAAHPFEALSGTPAVWRQHIANFPQMSISRYHLFQPWQDPAPPTLQAWMVVGGSGTLQTVGSAQANPITLQVGKTVLLTALTAPVIWTPRETLELLCVELPSSDGCPAHQ